MERELFDAGPRLTLFTSYYSAGKLIKESGLVPVRTSIGGPRFLLGYAMTESCSLLMPTRPMLKMEYEPYREMYRDILEGHGFAKIHDELARISERNNGRGLVLLCFENLAKPGNWCHRRILADWWGEKTGVVIPELEPVTAKTPQPTLFD